MKYKDVEITDVVKDGVGACSAVVDGKKVSYKYAPEAGTGNRFALGAVHSDIDAHEKGKARVKADEIHARNRIENAPKTPKKKAGA